MTDYAFQEGIPSDFTVDFITGIFHDQRHLELQAPRGWHSFVLINTKAKTILAHVNYHLEDSFARSPFRSPYGSFLFSKTVSETILAEFVAFTELKLIERGIETLQLKNSPDIYSPEESKLLQRVLLKSGYEIKGEEISAVIQVTDLKFESILHRSEKKRLRKCNESGLRFHSLPLNSLPDVYQFLKACREEKGYKLSMSLHELQEVAHIFPENFFLTSVYMGNELVAANISIRVTPHVLYNFYHDHTSSYDSLSPVVLLNKG